MRAKPPHNCSPPPEKIHLVMIVQLWGNRWVINADQKQIPEC
jgi:hypothetical protein